MLNRTICDVLKEMRNCIKTQNFSYLAGLIEEAQTLVNRMEAGLWDQNDIKSIREEHKKLKEEVKELEEEKQKLDGNKPKRNPFRS